MYSAIIVSALLASVTADGFPNFLKNGKCASPSIQDKFDLSKYSGRWYMSQLIENPYLPVSSCIHSSFDYSDVDYGFRVSTAGINSDDEYLKQEGKIYPTKDFPAAHMLIDFPSAFAAPFQVIETDYETYSCVYSCIDFTNSKTEFGFVYSRTPQTSGPATKKCAAVFEKNGIDFSKFDNVPQTAECVYRA